MIRKISNNCLAAAPSAETKANEAVWRALGLPDISTLPPPKHKHLALVGGGPSINHNKNALRKWRGDVWAINHAALWCASNKIDCSMFTVCPGWGWKPEIATVKRAIVATQSCQELIGLLRNTRVVTFEIGDNAGPGSGPTAVPVALRNGYDRITFFGFEGDYHGQQHGYSDVSYEKHLIVATAGQKFLTNVAFLMSALWLAALLRQFPARISERSGGLLAALVKDIDYDVVGISGSDNPVFANEYNDFIARTQALRSNRESSVQVSAA